MLGNDISDTDAQDLVEKIGTHPLELYQAASYLFQTNIRWEEYLKQLSEGFNSSSTGSRISQASIWNLTKIELKNVSPLAFEWLQIFACLNGKNIPAKWIGMPRETRDHILQLLLGYGLIRYDTAYEAIFLHDRIREIIQGEEGHSQIEQRAISLVRKMGEGLYRKGEAFTLWVPHAQRVLGLPAISEADKQALKKILATSKT